MTLYFDVETLGDDPATIDHDLRAYLARDYGDPDAADGDRLERLALNPMTGSVVVASVWDTDKGGACFAIVDDEEYEIAPGFRLIPCDNEAELVRLFWKTVGARRRIASWSGDEFDIPFMVARASLHGVRVPRWVIDAKPWESRVVDVCKKLAGPDRLSRRTLDTACRMFGVRSPKTELSGAEVGAAWLAGRRLLVAIYCCDDVRALAEIGERYFAATDESPEPAKHMPPAPSIPMPEAPPLPLSDAIAAAVSAGTDPADSPDDETARASEGDDREVEVSARARR